jgi:predicted Zn-dependent peptidase
MSSRLFMEIREHRGLAYDISSYTEHFLNSGSFGIYAGVDPDNTEAALVAILEELSKVRQGIAASDLTRAKELSKGRLYLRFEDSQNVALWYGSQEILLQQILDIDDVIAIVDAITADQLQEVAQSIFSGNGLNLAVTGPAKEDSPIRENRLRQLLKL